MRLTAPFVFLLVILAGCMDNAGENKQTLTPPAAANAFLSNDSSQLTSIEWKEETINLGKIQEGQKLEVAFHFKNTGTKPLVIDRVSPGCGCTVAETPKEPIAPGKEGVIKGAFDSNGRVGTQHKTIFVYANTKGSKTHELVFNVEVQKKS